MLNVESSVQFAAWAQRLADASSWIEGWAIAYLSDEASPVEILERVGLSIQLP